MRHGLPHDPAGPRRRGGGCRAGRLGVGGVCPAPGRRAGAGSGPVFPAAGDPVSRRGPAPSGAVGALDHVLRGLCAPGRGGPVRLGGVPRERAMDLHGSDAGAGGAGGAGVPPDPGPLRRRNGAGAGGDVPSGIPRLRPEHGERQPAAPDPLRRGGRRKGALASGVRHGRGGAAGRADGGPGSEQLRAALYAGFSGPGAAGAGAVRHHGGHLRSGHDGPDELPLFRDDPQHPPSPSAGTGGGPGGGAVGGGGFSAAGAAAPRRGFLRGAGSPGVRRGKAPRRDWRRSAACSALPRPSPCGRWGTSGSPGATRCGPLRSCRGLWRSGRCGKKKNSRPRREPGAVCFGCALIFPPQRACSDPDPQSPRSRPPRRP